LIIQFPEPLYYCFPPPFLPLFAPFALFAPFLFYGVQDKISLSHFTAFCDFHLELGLVVGSGGNVFDLSEG